MEMGGNPEKRCSIMRGWDIVFVHTAGKTLLKWLLKTAQEQYVEQQGGKPRADAS